ncbi:MAG: outer membrane beta-barrel domain-containing protein [Bdellovibrionaceae bacterium]|nr:outer membrane beta-barrel domain-containing protein [Pseudobdellovibrionaceae bacterium]
MTKLIFLAMSLFLIASPCYSDEIDSIEGLFDADENREKQKASDDAKKAESVAERPPEVKVNKLENLNQLKPFEDVAVIQKRYLPKTQRFEGNFNAAANINDSFFSAYGLGGGLTYNFTEKWSAEIIVKWFSVSNSKASNQLLERGVVTNGMVATELFYGADLRWTPIYGKFSYFDKKIIPFDHYFSIGIGQTQLKAGSSTTNTAVFVESLDDPMTLRISTGEVFALTKWMAFRWDVSWHFMQPEVRTTNGSNVSVTDDLQNNLFLSFGLSFFFPEARYR